jgi:hypothetical protein
MAKAALAIARGDQTETEKVRLIEAAFADDADRLILLGMEQTILAARARFTAIKGGAK